MKRKLVLADLKWLAADPPSTATAGLTAYRKSIGESDLFSVYVRFKEVDAKGFPGKAEIGTLAEAMEARLSLSEDMLMITLGNKALAEASVKSISSVDL